MVEDFILQQISDITIDPCRPMLVCDADEVLVHFALPLKNYFADHGYHLSFESYDIFNNVKHQQTQNPLEKKLALQFIDRFFQENVETCPPVNHAADSLNHIAEHAQVIIYSNLPLHAKDRRQASLKSHGMDFPLISGRGLKGPTMNHLTAKLTAPCVFVDDLPHNIDSVKQHASHVDCVHMVAEPQLQSIVPTPKHRHQRIDCWKEAKEPIMTLLSHPQSQG